MSYKWADKLVPEGSVREDLHTWTLKRKIRYWCYRLQAEATGGNSSKGKPAGLKPYYEKQKWFDGWENFAITWDVEADDPFTTKPRWESVHEEWERTLEEELRANKIQTRKNLRKQAASGSEGQL